MSESFPLRPDPDWYASLVARYGRGVPPIEHLQFRRGLQKIVADMVESLTLHGLFDALNILSIVTRNAGFTVIDARYRPDISDGDRIALDFALERAQARLSETCEHCGKPGEIVLKIGMEARLADPDFVLGDRLLCAGCYESWRAHDG